MSLCECLSQYQKKRRKRGEGIGGGGVPGKVKYWMCEYKNAFPKLKTRNPRAIIQIQEFMQREKKNPMVVLY